MFAVVQAAECGHLTEGLALEWAMLCLRCGDAAGALAAARSAVGALPGSAAAWRQLITLQARQAAHAELANAEGSNGAAPPPGSDSGSSSSSEDEGQGPAGHSQRQRQQGRQLGTLVLEAVRAVDVESAPPLWLTGLQALVGCGAPLDGLCRLLTEVVSGLARGPVEVSGAGMQHAAQQARVAWPRAPIPLRVYCDKTVRAGQPAWHLGWLPQRAPLATPLQGGMGAVAAAVLAAVECTQGLEAARRLYRGLLKLPPAGGELMHAILDMELLVAEAGAGASSDGAKPLAAAQLRELFEVRLGCGGWGPVLAWAVPDRVPSRAVHLSSAELRFIERKAAAPPAYTEPAMGPPHTKCCRCCPRRRRWARMARTTGSCGCAT